MTLPKLTLGMGDRFAHQGRAQLQAILDARKAGIDLYPVWNKSFREHKIVGSQPADLRAEADHAIWDLRWSGAQFVASLRHDPSCPEYNPHLRAVVSMRGFPDPIYCNR